MLPFNALGAFLVFRRHEAFRQRNVLVPIERCEAVKRDAVILINLMLKNLLGFVEGLNRGIACSLDGTGFRLYMVVRRSLKEDGSTWTLQ